MNAVTEVMIPIEASLFNDVSQNQKITGYNIFDEFQQICNYRIYFE